MSSVAADSTDVGQESGGLKNRHYFATMGLALAKLKGGNKLIPSSSTAETSNLPGYSVGSRSGRTNSILLCFFEG